MTSGSWPHNLIVMNKLTLLIAVVLLSGCTSISHCDVLEEAFSTAKMPQDWYERAIPELAKCGIDAR